MAEDFGFGIAPGLRFAPVLGLGKGGSFDCLAMGHLPYGRFGVTVAGCCPGVEPR